ncbi:MAG: NUDIX hydrolase [Bryobacteraceae bacterium]|nr:NUDIX hydrolase [Bryobacteraceae bacterium]
MKKTTTPPKLDYSNRFMDIRHTRADFGAFHKDYYVVDLGPRAGIVALRDGCVLMTRQYRFLIDGYSWEIPGGRVDAGESPEVAAVRECVEETGIRCSELKPLVVYYPGLDNFDNRTSLFYSEKVEVAAPFAPNDAEVVEISWVAVDTCLDMIFRGEILDALTVAGLLACQVRRPGT